MRPVSGGSAPGLLRNTDAAHQLLARAFSARVFERPEPVSASSRFILAEAEVQVNSLFERTMELFHRVDILINNAGATDGGPLSEMSVEMWDKVIATNLRGPFLCTRSAMRIMKSQGRGRILNIGSISAQRPRLNSAPYASSKFGLSGLTIVTALEGREYGVSACCLHPGNVRTEGSAEEVGAICGIPEYSSEPMMEVEEIAEVAKFMATLPPHMNMLETIVLPVKQAYLGRG